MAPFKNFMPYEEASLYVQSLGIKSKYEWDALKKFGKRLSDRLPSDPRESYTSRGKWTTWGKFLGTDSISDWQRRDQFLPYEEAKKYLKQFNFKSEVEFYMWAKSGSKPDFIPGSPRDKYKNSNFSMGDFLGNGNVHTKNFLPYSEAKSYAISLGFLTCPAGNPLPLGGG